MKLDLLNGKWLDIVFEGRNKIYGAYDLRKNNTKTNVRALLIGAFIFSLAIATPLLISLIPDSSDDQTLNQTITTVKLPPKTEQPKEDLKPPPPPPPKQDVVKFVKPVVAKTEDVREDPPPVEKLENKNLGKEDIKGDPNADLDPGPIGDGPKAPEVTEDNNIYNSAGIEVKPEFPGGMTKFYGFIQKNYTAPDEPGLKGQVFVSFVVEKDGTLTDIKVLRDIGYGTGKEAERVLRKSPRWTPAEQNGKKVRCSYQIPIKIETPEE
ncbi:energy transducer TonB [Flavobacterium sp.]|uniref:energy transducer TonB n=1 Tax=Flavobacterium sp. TaxID=239 RepID=UPI003750F587